MLRAAALAIVVLLIGAGAAEAKPTRPCERTALVAEGAQLRGCVADGPWRTLATSSCDLACLEWSLPRRTGTLAAYVAFSHWKCATTTVEVVDLRTGRPRAALNGGSDFVSYDANGCSAWGGSVTDLVLRGGGGVAFVDIRWDRSVEVVRADRRGVRVLAHDAAIEPTSLTLNGDRVAWRDGGVARSASLGAGPAPGTPSRSGG
jgi:hypothetical protein